MSVLELRVCARYKLFEKIGGGQYGQIYRAQNAQNNLDCAIKMEEIKSKHPQVLYEGKIMQNLQGGRGIPSMYWCGQEGDFNFLVMEYLDQTLAQLQQKCGGKFSLRCVLLIIREVLKNIEYVHFKNYVHRDFKPENFMIGRGKKSNNFFTIDFGLSKKFIDIQTHQHIPWRDKKPLIGTARYASVNAHKGCELSRRDDLESAAYMFIHMLTGKLPWQGINARSKDEKHIKVRQMKMNMAEEDICDGVPSVFAKFLKYAKGLKFEEKPNYNYINKLFESLSEEHNYLYDDVYDWWLIEKQAEVFPKNQLNNNIEVELPYDEDIIEDEEEFIKSLNLNQYDRNEEVNYVTDILPLDDIKLTKEERIQMNQMEQKTKNNWKDQQKQCVEILKEQQFLVNERDMKLQTNRIKDKNQGVRYDSQCSRVVNTQLQTQQNEFEEQSVTQRGNTRPNLQNQIQSQQKPNHQKKKSQCVVF